VSAFFQFLLDVLDPDPMPTNDTCTCPDCTCPNCGEDIIKCRCQGGDH